MKKRGEFSGLKWETHCHSVYSNRRKRWFDALNTPREMIESAIRRGLDGMIITDHDTVKGGLAGKKIARGINGFHVIPGDAPCNLFPGQSPLDGVVKKIA